VRGEKLGTPSDVYSLGVVLYELLCGQRPYKLKRSSAAMVEQAILEADPPLPSAAVNGAGAQARSGTLRELQRQLRGDLDTIVLKALKKRPEDRYGTVAELAEDLRRQRNHEPVLARPDSFAYRARKYVGRNMLVVASVASVVLALSSGLAISTWQYRLATEETRIARDEAKTSAAVQAFMQNLFTAESVDDANPENAATIRAGQLLASAVEQAKSAMTDTPRARVKMLVMLSQLYLERRILEQAVETGQLAVDTASQLGPASQEMTDSLKAYSVALDFSYRFDEAMAAMTRRLQILRTLRPDDPTVHLDAEMSLGGLLVHTNPSQALPHILAAAALARALHNDKELVTALFYQANALNRGTTNDPAQARAAALESLQVAARLKGTPEGRVVGVRELPQYQELSSAAIALDDPAEALRYAQLGFAGARKFHLPGDALARRHSANLARAYVASGQPLAAIDFLDRTWHLSDPAQPDPIVLEQTMVLSAYQQAQVVAGRVEDALATFDRIMALGQRVRVQPDWPAAFHGSRAAALIELGQVEAGMVSIRAASDAAKASGIKSEFLLPLLGDLDCAHGDTAAVRARVAAFKRGRQEPLSLRDQWRLDGPLAKAALQEHRLEEAAALAAGILERIAGYAQRKAVADVEADALWVRARQQLARGQATDAVETMDRAVALFEGVVDPRLSLRLAGMLETLAQAKVSTGDRVEATPLLWRVKEICARHPGGAIHHPCGARSPGHARDHA
jgi:serine/threonine-protein kinase